MLRLLQHPATILLLCFSLIGTPVTYRGGAHDPHPHMFLEFLMDAEAGNFDHHHHDGDADETGPATHGRLHAPLPASGTPARTGAAERFGATLTVFIVGDVGQLAYILPTHALSQSDHIESALIAGDQSATGMTYSPITPPPQ